MTNKRLDAVCVLRIARLRTVDNARAWNKAETVFPQACTILRSYALRSHFQFPRQCLCQHPDSRRLTVYNNPSPLGSQSGRDNARVRETRASNHSLANEEK
jgi:hypothetical protein